MALIDKLTSIADKIRNLMGLSEEMGLVAMSENLEEAVNECDAQAELIEQIKTALEGKAAGGGGATLLYTAEVTEPVSVITIDIPDDWKRYTTLIARPRQLEMSTAEWLCITTNKMGLNYLAASGGSSNTLFNTEHSEIILLFKGDKGYFVENSDIRTEYSADEIKKINFRPYYSQNTIISGSIDILGVML